MKSFCAIFKTGIWYFFFIKMKNKNNESKFPSNVKFIASTHMHIHLLVMCVCRCICMYTLELSGWILNVYVCVKTLVKSIGKHDEHGVFKIYTLAYTRIHTAYKS